MQKHNPHGESAANNIRRKFRSLHIDLELPEINGFQLIHLLQEQMSDCKILIYTMHEEPWVIAKLAEEEISGAVSKMQVQAN